MAHALHRATLALATPFGTPLAGDTLFGQLCWALRETQGEAQLVRRLDGYTQGNPWLVVSDGFPAGYLPKPTLPQYFEALSDPAQRKAAKKKRWILAAETNLALDSLLAAATDDATAFSIPNDGSSRVPVRAQQSHNTIDRQTGTTGEGEFAPYSMPLTIYAAGQRIDIYLVVDEERISLAEIGTLLHAVGAGGFGRDASIGLGKFSVKQLEPVAFAPPPHANAFWTLAPCAPQGLGFDGGHSYWRVLTRFGRHGNIHALTGKPFKTPVLLAATGAVLSPAEPYLPQLFIGQGLGADGSLSKAEPATVHQGYAPVLPLALPRATA
jgi:CRISPR-associated protein Csm4